MKVMKQASMVLLLALLAIVMPSCNDSSNNNESLDLRYDMVTLAGLTDGGSVFTYQTGQYTPVITLTSTQKVNNEIVKVGERLVIAYLPERGVEPNTSGAIQLFSYMPVLNATLLERTAAEENNFSSEGLYMAQAPWVTGDYLNINAGVYIRSEPKRFDFVVDKATLSTENPVIYIIFEADNDASGSDKTVYASCNISDIVSNPAYTKLTVKCANLIGPSEYDFNLNPSLAPAE